MYIVGVRKKKSWLDLCVMVQYLIVYQRIMLILSVVRDRDGYPHLLSEHYENDWDIDEIKPSDLSFHRVSYPGFESIRENKLVIYSRHELMLSKCIKI